MSVMASSLEQHFPRRQTSVTGKIKGSEPQQWHFKINIDFLQSSAMPAPRYHCLHSFGKKWDLKIICFDFIVFWKRGLCASGESGTQFPFQRDSSIISCQNPSPELYQRSFSLKMFVSVYLPCDFWAFWPLEKKNKCNWESWKSLSCL